MNVYPGPIFYNHLTDEAIEEIVEKHLVGGQPVVRWMFRPKATQTGKKPIGQWRP